MQLPVIGSLTSLSISKRCRTAGYWWFCPAEGLWMVRSPMYWWFCPAEELSVARSFQLLVVLRR